MLADDIEWKDEYGIGVESIDRDHQELFRIARRLFSIARDGDKNRWAAEEGIKFLKSYCLNHFRREEEYMRSINYPRLDAQVAQHIHLRDKVLPRIERHIVEAEYSREAMEKFLQIMGLWLARHILEHDKAIGAD